MNLSELKQGGSVLVLMGGKSAEREVSLQSGSAVAAALRSAGFNAEELDTAQINWLQVQAQKPDFCFIALHGGEGENGTVQAMLDLLTIPYSGSGVLGSALAMDKARSKQVWQALGLPTPDYVLVEALETGDLAGMLASLGGKVFVKPVGEGSSFGMGMATNAAELQAAIKHAQQYQQAVLVERCIEGDEYTVAILGDRALPSVRIETDRAFYDFNAKYLDDNTRFYTDSGLGQGEEVELQALAKKAFFALGCEGWGRVDVLRDAVSGEFKLLEVNTVPGMTSHSLVPMAAKACGLGFDQLVTQIVELGLQRAGT